MTRYHATVLLNLTSHFGDAIAGRDLFVSLAETTSIVVDAAAPANALEAVFAVGNQMGRDANGKEWSPDVRSMSTGDVVILHDGMGKGAYWACDSEGWSDVTGTVLNWISGTELAYQLADRFHAARAHYVGV